MTIRFRDLPLTVQLGFALTLLNSWILFEETVVDRTVLSKLLPKYGVGVACLWDAIAVVAIAGVVILLRMRPSR